MQRTTKTFIGGLVIGSVIGGLVSYLLTATWCLNLIS